MVTVPSATSRTNEAAGPFCDRCGHEPHDRRTDPRCSEIVAVAGPDNLAEISYEPIYCGCVDLDALYARTVRAEAFIGGITPEEWATIDKAREASRILEASPARLDEGSATPTEDDAGALAVILDECKGGPWKPDDGTSLWFYNAAGDQIHLTGDDVALLLHAALARAAPRAEGPLRAALERLLAVAMTEEEDVSPATQDEWIAAIKQANEVLNHD